MTIVFSHISALECARASCDPFLRRKPAPRTLALPDRTPSATDIEAVGSCVGPMNEPYHVLVSRRARPRTSRSTAPHAAASEELPCNSVLRLADRNGACSCSPELFFRQIAATAHRVELVRIGCELCGTYAISRQHADGFYPRSPLTTVARMRSHLNRTPGLHGTKAARWALQYVLEGSASPRETTVAMLLRLPCAFGGRGLEEPCLNHEVVVKRRVGRHVETKTYRIDLYWPSAKLGLEYDSDLKHTGPDRIAHDARRRNDLESAGITMLTATNKQVKILWEFNKLADDIAGILGRQFQPRCKDYPARQRELHALLMKQGL